MPSLKGYLQSSVTWGLLFSFFLFFISGLTASQNPMGSVGGNQEEEIEEEISDVGGNTADLLPPTQLFTETSSPVPVALSHWDEGVEVELLRGDGRVETLSLKDYLWGVVAAEMPASFPLEALKAQTVAARTYSMLRLENTSNKHGVGRLCDDSSCCQAYIDLEDRMASWGVEAPLYQAKIQQAVTETEGLFVLFQGNVIDAVFFSSAAGQTLDAREVWGADLPYLKSVLSPEGEDVPNYDTTVTFAKEELASLLQKSYPAMSLPSQGEYWFLNPVMVNGSVSQYTVGGVTLTGVQLRSVLGLRSTSFSVDYGEGVFYFQVQGYGHGVGLSQYGAKAMAEEGSHFGEILQWYYTDCEVAVLEGG